MSTISASTTTTTAYKITADTTGALVLQTGSGPTTAMTIDTSQNVGIGTSSPTEKLQVSASNSSSVAASVVNTQSSTTSFISCTSTTYSFAGIGASTSWYGGSGTVALGNYSAYPIQFVTNGSERARIDSSGSLLVGTTTGPGSGAAGLLLRNAAGTYGNIVAGKTASGTVDLIANYYNSTYVGGITYSNTATALVASSDERLKENITEAGAAIEKVKAIQVVSYDWKHDDSHVEFGVVAQQLNTIYPEAVNVGDEGEEIEKTWGVEYGRLTPLLLKAIQEQQAIITTLTERITALEAK